MIVFHGIILQIVREHYLRDDIWCGSNICTICAHENQELVLEEMPQSRNKMFQFPHYILLDTCVVLNQVSHITTVTLFKIQKNILLDHGRHRGYLLPNMFLIN